MPAEVLVMCPSCGLPQPPRERCIQCGAVLPQAPTPQGEGRRSFPPGRREVDLGDGRKLVFTPDAIEVLGEAPPVFLKVPNAIGQGGPGRLPLSSVRRASFSSARAYHALSLCVLAIVGGALVPIAAVRAAALLLLAVGIWLFLRSRTWVVRFEQSSGQPAVLVLGGGAPGSRRGVKAQSVWVDLSEELRRRGIDVRR